MGAGEGASLVHRILQHGVQAQGSGDAPAGPAESGEAVPQVFNLFLPSFGIVQVVTLSVLRGTAAWGAVNGGILATRWLLFNMAVLLSLPCTVVVITSLFLLKKCVLTVIQLCG